MKIQMTNEYKVQILKDVNCPYVALTYDAEITGLALQC